MGLTLSFENDKIENWPFLIIFKSHAWLSKLMLCLETISASVFVQIWSREYIKTVGVNEALSFLSTFILYIVYFILYIRIESPVSLAKQAEAQVRQEPLTFKSAGQAWVLA